MDFDAMRPVSIQFFENFEFENASLAFSKEIHNAEI